MKIISWNVNGLRAVWPRNILQEIIKENDIVCLQEIKLQESQLPLALLNNSNYFNYAVKKGYAGVAIISSQKPLRIEKKVGLAKFDEEGRFLLIEYPSFILINFYLPHGGRQKENLSYKLAVYQYLLDYLGRIQTKDIVLVGDFNIAHNELDLARPKDNKNNIMFTVEERRQLDNLIQLGFFDTFRLFNSEGGNYTWWPYYRNARIRNLGWRLDYILASNSLLQKVKSSQILSNILGSDHCPIRIELAN